MSAPKTVRVRIAVAVTHDGDWAAKGHHDWDEETMARDAAERVGYPSRLTWIEATRPLVECMRHGGVTIPLAPDERDATIARLTAERDAIRETLEALEVRHHAVLNEASALRAALGALVDAHWKCDADETDEECKCVALATNTNAFVPGGPVHCDAHRRNEDWTDLPYAAPLRAALALLGRTNTQKDPK